MGGGGEGGGVGEGIRVEDREDQHVCIACVFIDLKFRLMGPTFRYGIFHRLHKILGRLLFLFLLID